MKLDLVAIAPPDFDVDVTLAYATEANLTGRPVYRNADCWLHREAADRLAAAIELARPLGLRLRIFDALRWLILGPRYAAALRQSPGAMVNARDRDL